MTSLDLPSLHCTVIGIALDWESHKSLKHDRYPIYTALLSSSRWIGNPINHSSTAVSVSPSCLSAHVIIISIISCTAVEWTRWRHRNANNHIILSYDIYSTIIMPFTQSSSSQNFLANSVPALSHFATQKLTSRVALLRRLAGSVWGAGQGRRKRVHYGGIPSYLLKGGVRGHRCPYITVS